MSLPCLRDHFVHEESLRIDTLGTGIGGGAGAGVGGVDLHRRRLVLDLFESASAIHHKPSTHPIQHSLITVPRPE